jgi:hypothetical protein
MQGDLEAVHRAWQADHEEQPPDSVYAFPKQKKESMTDPSHVRKGLPGFDQVQGVFRQLHVVRRGSGIFAG